MNRSALFVLVAITSALAGCHMTPRVWVEEIETLDLDAGSLVTVQCRTHDGGIRVVGEEGVESVRVSIRKRGCGADDLDAAACLAAIQITQERDGDTLRLGWRWREPRRMGWGASVAFSLRQPRSLSADLRTHNGQVLVNGVQGAASASTHNGLIQIDGCRGKLRARTHNGPIVAAGEVSSVVLETHNGAIRATLDGSGSLGGNIKTHNGPVELTLGMEISSRISCRTHNGRVNTASHVTVLEGEKRRCVGEIGGGEGDLRVRAHNGSITLK